ncbi:MAG: FAD-dependent oxidoreductase [Spirochaetes bacterium]|nr:FAD-dependent oxidoreductase [Spirochaetota bacterium]
MKTEYCVSLPLMKSADVVVLGGGPAGIAAAIASARNGAKTILIEQHGCLGGMMTLGLVTPIGATHTKSGKPFGGILAEMLDRVAADAKRYAGGTEHLYSSPHVIKHVALDMVTESGSEILFHAMLVDVIREGNTIQGLVVATKSGLARIDGRIFIDATGDGDLIARAKEEFVIGSEPDVLKNLTVTGLDKVHEEDRAYGDYDESGLMQPVTVMFTMAGVDGARAERLINKRLTFADFGITKEEFAKLPYANTPGFTIDGEDIPLPQGRILFFKTARDGEYVINMSRVTAVDGADALSLSAAEIVAQKQVFYIADFLKRYVDGFQQSHIVESAATLGVRETRRLVGRYILSGREAIECVPFDDVIAHGSYIIDIHDPQGRRKAVGGAIKGDCFDIPYRSLVPKTITNLLASGRCISADHVAHSSTRIQGTCMLTGQAAGTAAALTLSDNAAVSALSVPALQKKLEEQGVRFYRR